MKIKNFEEVNFAIRISQIYYPSRIRLNDNVHYNLPFIIYFYRVRGIFVRGLSVKGFRSDLIRDE